MTLLEGLEHELLAADRRLEEPAPRRRRWLHGWPLLAIAVAATGTSVAVARVAEVGPFAYMGDGLVLGENPKLAATTTITLQPAGPDPLWQARAYRNGLNQLCITGGPRDPRTDPGAPAGRRRVDSPPQNGVLCASSEEIAQTLVDPQVPGATFANSSELDGSLMGRICRMSRKTGRCVPVDTDPATRLLVYGVRVAGAPRPVVRWTTEAGQGQATPMRASEQRLVLPVDKRPDGLSATEQRTLAGFPDRLELVLWAAEVPIPRGTRYGQIAFPGMLPDAADDATVDMIDQDLLVKLDRENRRRGRIPDRGIRRDAPPVTRVNGAQRRWIAAFGRSRGVADDVPERLRTDQVALGRFGYPVSRRLDIVGGGLRDVWIAPGGMPEEMQLSNEGDDQVCFAGSPLLIQCKTGQRNWKRPFVEAVSCTQGAGWPTPLTGHRTLVWALTPRGATTVELRGPGARTETLRAGELLAVRRPADERIRTIVWTTDAGRRITARVPWPRSGPRCEPGAMGGQIIRKDNAGSYEESSGRPAGTR